MKNIYDVSRQEIIEEIKRIEKALKIIKSPNLQKDYRKYLSRLNEALRRYH